MSTPPVPIAFLDRRRPAGPVHRSILAVDLEGSTQRTDLVKGEVRRVMYDLLAHSLEAVGITGNRLERLIDRGDGVLVLIRPHDQVPKTVLLGRLVPLLATLLAEYNARALQPALCMRLRVVIHAGEIHEDGRGFYGEAIDIAIRLLDAPAVKRTLKQSAGPLVLVVSDEIYYKIVRHGYVPADAYLPLVRVQVANRWQRGWVHIPAAAAASAADLDRPQRASGQRPNQPHPRFRFPANGGHKRAVRSGHR
jgi:hypothetical protein